MRKAFDEVLNHGMNIRRAAKKYGVPKSTLSDKVNKVNFISAFGKKPGIR